MNNYKINPEIVLFQRDGVLFSSKLTSTEKIFQIQNIDLVLLNLLLKYSSEKIVINKFLKNKYTKILVPNIDESGVKIQIENYINASILLKTKERQKFSKNVKLKLRSEKCEKILEKGVKYRLSHNFILAPSNKGFVLWSSLREKNYYLDIEELFVIFSISNGKNINEIMPELGFVSKNVIENIFKNLIENKLIIPLQETKEQNVIETKQDKAYSSGVNNKKPSWEYIAPDNRIPVYFVPHMENHLPLALGLLFSSIEAYEDSDLLKHFNLIPITYFTPEMLLNHVYRKFGKGVWLFSNYMWSLELNLEISKLVKNHDSENITIHGGPSTPNYEQATESFLNQHQSIDIAVHGEGEVAICEILSCFKEKQENRLSVEAKLKEVTGLTFRNHDQFASKYLRTEDRVRLQEPDSIPSPYIQGVFDNYKGRVDAAIIESNRGCPFGCTFCDWGSATNQKVRKYDLERTKEEIEWIGKNKIQIIWIADANFGMYDRDIELSEHIVKIKQKYGFPKEVVVNYTKNTTWRLAEIIKHFSKGKIISQGIISIQTTDKTTLEVINRKNIKTTKYDELAKVFTEMKLPLSTDLMIGLPGITVEAFIKDLQRYIDLDVSVKAYPTQLLPNSPMAHPDYLKKYKIKTGANDFIISSYSFTEKDLEVMKKIYKFYTIAEGYSLLRYITRYMQWQYEINAMELITLLISNLENKPSKYPHVSWVFQFFDIEKCIPGGWNIFYNEIEKFILQNFEINSKSELNTVIKVNKASMPDESLEYPVKYKLAHDFEKYFKENADTTGNITKRLNDYESCEFLVSDPNSMATVDHKKLQYDTHQYFWELNTSISRAKSASV